MGTQVAELVRKKNTAAPAGDLLPHAAVRSLAGPVLQAVAEPGSAFGRDLSRVPAIVHEVLRSPGQPLDAQTRAVMEPSFGRDWSQVQVHTDQRAAESAHAVHALAYTVGRDVVFAEGEYRPHSTAGQRLLAHELTHVAQQAQAAPVLSRQEEPERRKEPVTTRPAFSLSWDALGSLGQLALTPPSMLSPSSRGAVPSAALSPTTPSATPAGTTPELPSRLPVLTSGRFSLGLRLGFPELFPPTTPGAPPSAAAESLRRAETLNWLITGNVPTGWEAVDKGQLARAVWGIFSTHIAPDLARSLTSRLSTPAGPAGARFELDAVLLTDFSGGGLSFTIRY